MMAIIGMFFQDGLTGSAWGDWSLYTASPLRAAGSFAGYQAPQVEKSGRAAVVARRAENIAATAIANGNFTILVKALQKAGLVETMSGETPYTVFAPTDAAFADLLKELGVTAEQLLANPDLKSILLYHVAGGTTMSSSLKDGMRVTSAQGGQLAVQIGGGNVKVGRATVTSADVACSNGVIHVIDKVLLPPAAPAAPFDPAKQIGAMAPLGFFDPLGFSKKGDKAGFNNLQASEIKHGRVAMMAALGAVVQHYVKFPGFESVPSGLGAVTTAPGTYGFAALFLVSGALELAIWTQDEKKEPGNFGDPAGLNMYNPEMRARKTKLAAELANGRLAMMAIIGIFFQDGLIGSAHPMRPERVHLSRRLNTPVPKAMMAALGAVVQHYVKFPGFESVPSGLGAVTTAPGTYGFAALFLVSGVLELAIWTQDEKKEPGNFGDPAGLNMYNPEMREKEINNGRMGMFSAIGIIAAEALSGKDGMNQLGF
ncbi:unnamed protein product [Polarella glacialis]|uniref:FAS1 domain-containing protein n=1 Tax=Polarella glacialis TaxID=89957 RepID=A0A813FMW6_POLGL|nr:unnamed protein product [Polarella glacialis]